MPHDGPAGVGHNHHHHGDHHHHDHDTATPWHLHSHMDPADRAAELRTLATQFIEGFRAAGDKTSFLRLAGVPFERRVPGGGPSLKLVDVEIVDGFQVGTAAPAFGSRELVYMPYPGQMVRERTTLRLVYVSLDQRVDLDLMDWLSERQAAGVLG